MFYLNFPALRVKVTTSDILDSRVLVTSNLDHIKLKNYNNIENRWESLWGAIFLIILKMTFLDSKLSEEGSWVMSQMFCEILRNNTIKRGIKKIRLLGAEHKIFYEDIEEFGFFVGEEKHFIIREGLSTDLFRITMIHELIHAISDYMNITNLEENDVDTLAIWLAHILKENKDVVRARVCNL